MSERSTKVPRRFRLGVEIPFGYKLRCLRNQRGRCILPAPATNDSSCWTLFNEKTSDNRSVLLSFRIYLPKVNLLLLYPDVLFLKLRLTTTKKNNGKEIGLNSIVSGSFLTLSVHG